jgi:hypothetical protein
LIFLIKKVKKTKNQRFSNFWVVLKKHLPRCGNLFILPPPPPRTCVDIFYKIEIKINKNTNFDKGLIPNRADERRKCPVN